MIADCAGRKLTIMLANLIFIGGEFLACVAPYVWWLMIARVVTGFGIGVASMINPLYMSEIAPVGMRGRMVAIYVSVITLGQITGQTLTITLDRDWRAMFAVGMAAPALQFLLMLFLPETQRWYMKYERYDKAKIVLEKVYQEEFRASEFDKLKVEFDTRREEIEMSGSQKLKSLFTTYKKCAAVGILLQVLQQFIGINAIMYYSPEIIIDTGSSLDEVSDEDHLGILLSIPITITNFIGSICAIFIIDKLGRRYLMLRAIPGVTVTLVLISIWFFFCVFGGDESTKMIARIWVFVLLIIYRSLFGNGMSWSVWAINTEIYPIHIADTAIAISTSFSWLSSFIVASWFLSGLETDAGKVFSFDILAIFGVIAFIYVYVAVPETAGQTIEYNVQFLITGKDPNEAIKEAEAAAMGAADDLNPLMGMDLPGDD